MSGPMTADAVRRVRPRAVLLDALRLLRVRHVDRPAAPRRRLPRRAARRHRPGGRRRDARRRRACSSAAARRRWSRRAAGRACSAEIPLAAGAEVTVECNPDDVTEELLADVRRRRRQPDQPIGVQSMVPHVLAAARPHARPDNVDRRRRSASATSGSPSFNLDLIYGAAGETLADWRTTLRAARSRSTRRTSRPTGSPSRPARRSPTTRPAIPTTTSRPTSTSSPTTCSPPPGSPTTRCRTGPGPGHECRHNLLYWRQHDYLGFGCAAHSHRAGRRWWNVRTPERYIAAVARRPADRGRRRDARRRHPPRRGPAAGAAHDGAACPLDALDGDALRRPRRAATATAGCSPAAAACWPTRSRSACADADRPGPEHVARNGRPVSENRQVLDSRRRVPVSAATRTWVVPGRAVSDPRTR